MLLDHFYSLRDRRLEGDKLTARITFHPEHPIFAGHFPGQPVVPGVCMMQILREILEAEAGKRLMIRSGDNLKFLAVINPEERREVDVSLAFARREKTYNIQASIQAGEVVFFKFKGTFEEKI